MKSLKKSKIGRELRLATLLTTVLCGFAAGAAPAVIVNETFDPPGLALSGWDGGSVQNISREYVSTGVAGSTAVQLSANLVDNSGYVAVILYQDGQVIANDLATRANTVLSFDVKVDQPGMQNLLFLVQSWEGFYWDVYLPGQLSTASRGYVPIGVYVPGTFKMVTVALDDPLWIEDPYSGPLAGPFEPAGKTYQIYLQVDSACLPTLGQFAVTVDNIKVTSKNPMVPWKAVTQGTAIYSEETGGYIVQETGVDTHLGKYTESAVLSSVSWGLAGDIEITAANGDKLVGLMSWLPTGQLGVAITDGTGRFKGAQASYIETLNWTSDTAFTASGVGSIGRVGSNTK